MRKKRNFDELREIEFTPSINRYAEGSCLAKFGHTHVICTASIEEKIPQWLKNTGQGWITAEYGMLPRSTHSRMDREASKGKQSGRTQEIQRLIGRSLRAVVNLETLGEKQVKVDCDVIQADGGTRTAGISGGFVALAMALNKYKSKYNIKQKIIREHVGAISCGIINNQPNIDLDYDEDSSAQADANFVISENSKIIEIQTTAELSPFDKNIFIDMMDLANEGIKKIIKKQKEALEKFE